MKKTLILIRGASGSGKSTMAKNIIDSLNTPPYLSELNVKHFEADQYFTKNGTYAFDPKQLPEAHRECFESTKNALNDNETNIVIVTNTFVKKWEIKPYIDLANSMDNVDLKIWRMETQYENTHGVPQEKVEKQRNNMEDIEGEVILN